MSSDFPWLLAGTVVYPLLFAIHLTLALLAGLGHFPARRRWQRVATHVLTGAGFAMIGLSTSTLRPVLAREIASPVTRLIWVALIGVWGIVFYENIRLELARRRARDLR